LFPDSIFFLSPYASLLAHLLQTNRSLQDSTERNQHRRQRWRLVRTLPRPEAESRRRRLPATARTTRCPLVQSFEVRTCPQCVLIRGSLWFFASCSVRTWIFLVFVTNFPPTDFHGYNTAALASAYTEFVLPKDPQRMATGFVIKSITRDRGAAATALVPPQKLTPAVTAAPDDLRGGAPGAEDAAHVVVLGSHGGEAEQRDRYRAARERRQQQRASQSAPTGAAPTEGARTEPESAKPACAVGGPPASGAWRCRLANLERRREKRSKKEVEAAAAAATLEQLKKVAPAATLERPKKATPAATLERPKKAPRADTVPVAYPAVVCPSCHSRPGQVIRTPSHTCVCLPCFLAAGSREGERTSMIQLPAF
jgi:hypothetical protein